jgi:hypothetical protein
MKIINTFEQNTDAWIQYKLGKFSASTADKLLMDKKTIGYQDLIGQIVEERITGNPYEGKWQGNEFTDRGHEFEPEAVEDYETKHLIQTQKVGVIELDDWVLCSPDRLIDDNGLLQVKCPIFKTQKEYLKTEKVPGNYYKQMQFELFVSGRDFNVFYSYHPFLKPLEVIIERDDEMIAEIGKRLIEAKKDVLNEIKLLTNG